MARCKPVFPALEPNISQNPSVPSSFSSAVGVTLKDNYLERMVMSHAKFDGLADELCPPSRTPSPISKSRADLLTEKVSEAVSLSGHNPAHPKWSHVARILKMACTSRLYRGTVPGVRIGEKAKVDIGNYEWVLPDTAEEWEECEEKWQQRFSNPPSREGQSSKYWPPKVEKAKITSEVKTPTKAEIVRDKVQAWRAEVIAVADGGTHGHTDDVEPIPIQKKTLTMPPKRQSPIDFPVTKPVAAVSANKTNTRLNAQVPHTTPPSDQPLLVQQPEPASHASPAPIQIAELSEMSFLPPSFPAQLETSTPPNADKAKAIHKPRSKPEPILPLRVMELPSSSSPRIPNNHVHRILSPPLESSTLPIITPSPIRPVKRPHPLTPLPEQTSSPTKSDEPQHKKQRTDTSPLGLSDAPAPPTTSLPSNSPPRTPSPIVPKGLGNAKGLPILSTPNANGLPTLTELLASSRRSKPRPRPPSRKAKSGAVPLAAVSNNENHGKALAPVAELDPVSVAREESPVPTIASRAKTVFSSPASGSSGSPESLRERPRSPISPLFSRSFAPPFMSTQNGGAERFGDMAASQAAATGLAAGGSGVLGMGYNSQFDLEGQIDMVSDLLERDVDFDGWLRDIPEVDADG